MLSKVYESTRDAIDQVSDAVAKETDSLVEQIYLEAFAVKDIVSGPLVAGTVQGEEAKNLGHDFDRSVGALRAMETVIENLGLVDYEDFGEDGFYAYIESLDDHGGEIASQILAKNTKEE